MIGPNEIQRRYQQREWRAVRHGLALFTLACCVGFMAALGLVSLVVGR